MHKTKISSSSQRRRLTKRKNKSFPIWLVILAGAIFVVGGFLVLRNGQGDSGGQIDPMAVDNLLPLTEPVNPLHGWHDMDNLPNLNQPGDSLPANQPQPNVDIPVTYYDFGTIPSGPDDVSQTFPIQNTGDQPLEINRIVTSCGCTTADLTSSVIQPGKQADLTVVFDPDFHDTAGPVKRIVWLETNDPDQPLVEVSFTANVRKN